MKTTITTGLTAAALIAVTGCAQPLPGVVADPLAPPPSSEPTLSNANDEVVVQYYVQCRLCTVEYSTTNGVGVAEVEKARRIRVRFANTGPTVSVMMNVVPLESSIVRRARISRGTRVLAESEGPHTANEPVQLSAVIN